MTESRKPRNNTPNNTPDTPGNNSPGTPGGSPRNTSGAGTPNTNRRTSTTPKNTAPTSGRPTTSGGGRSSAGPASAGSTSARPTSGGGRSSGGSTSAGSKSARPTSAGSKSARPTSGRPTSGGRTSGGRTKPSGDRRDNPNDRNRRDGKPTDTRGARASKPTDTRRDTRGAPPARRDTRQQEGDRTAAQRIYDGPPIPDDVSATDLDKHARQALQALPDKLADKVARHLVMAGLLINDDPETAHLHALAARARATRTGLVREASGETAYACGKWAEALSELRTARRMNGSHAYTPMMADCERALKHPDKAIAYDTPQNRAHLDEAGQIELTIVIAGARRDQNQHQEAIRLLETEPLHTKGRHDWVPRLRYAYADALAHAGRTDEAIQWFHRTIATDAHNTTDAHTRITQLTTTPPQH